MVVPSSVIQIQTHLCLWQDAVACTLGASRVARADRAQLLIKIPQRYDVTSECVISKRLWARQWRVQFYDRQTHTPHVHVNVSLFIVLLQPLCFISLSFLLFKCIKYSPLTSSTRSGLRLLRMIPSPVMLQKWLSLPGSAEIFNLPPAITTPPDVSTQQSSTSWRDKTWETPVTFGKQSQDHRCTEYKGDQSLVYLATQ